MGGYHLNYHADPSAPVVGLLDTKIHSNSIILDIKKGARYCAADIQNYYLNNNLAIFQYTRIHKKYFTQKLCKEYDIDKIVDPDGYVYCEIRKGMYGLNEAGCVAFQNLVKIGTGRIFSNVVYTMIMMPQGKKKNIHIVSG